MKNTIKDQSTILISFGLAFLVYGFLIQAVSPKPVASETKALETKSIETMPIDIRTQIQDLAQANGFKPSKRIIEAIVIASETHQIDALELTAIGIVETGLGKYSRTRLNSNGTHDKGVFQINTVNYPKCIEYNLDSVEGSSLCAAKLLSQIKTKRADYLGVYHSKTPSKKAKYIQKITQVLALNADKQ